ncbi:MAG TPA: DUF6519 domain-containing protein [Pyrinomonadaceae bacterium]|nr:DUF6519 domain-containing protein [Pyrinomonadaceae bacterium]
MKGDFSRDTFDPAKHYARVLMQQGRVLLDSDWNEQSAIQLHFLRRLGADLIGPAGGPQGACGFKIMAPAAFIEVDGEVRSPGDESAERFRKLDLQRNFLIGPGRYYVDGVLCENERTVLYARAEKARDAGQPDLDAGPLENDKRYLVYLGVWHRDVSALEDASIREVALGAHGPDTALRSKVVWQVNVLELDDDRFDKLDFSDILESEAWREQLETFRIRNPGMLRAKADEADDPNAASPCIISPDARYRGAENQLYRVEIHVGGAIGDGPTFKWSRENGSVALPVREISGQQVTLDSLGRDARLGLQVGDYVEITDDNFVLRRRAEPLLRVTDIDAAEMIVTLSGTPSSDLVNTEERPAILRRWEGTGPIKEAAGGNENWIELEDGIKIQFQPGAFYRTGNYWLIPARTATGDVEWPGPVGDPEPRPPHGIERHFAPLARISVEDSQVTVETDFRRAFAPLAVLPADPPH